MIRPTILAQPASSILGREREIAQLVDLVLDPSVRLVTLVGPGGIGKTRLGLEVAHLVADRFDDGAVMVQLDTARTDDG